MKRRLASNSGIKLLSAISAVALAACGASVRAADHALATNNQATVTARTKGASAAEKARAQHIARTRISMSSTSASRRGLGHSKAAVATVPWDELAALEERLDRQEQLLAAQQLQIAKLIAALEEQKRQAEGSPQAWTEAARTPNLGQVAGLRPVLPVIAGGSPLGIPTLAAPVAVQSPSRLQVANHRPAIPAVAGGGVAASPMLEVPASSPAAPVTREEIQSYTARVTELGRSLDGVRRGLAGFRFNGDFRLRSDAQLRTGNSLASPVQNVRGRYRLRFNVDKDLSDQFDFHFTVASGRFDNGLTSDSDFAGFDTRGPIFISEASAGYHPNEHLSLRGGRLPEVFADDSRFLFKEEIRFTGFQEIGKLPVGSNALGITSIEFRAGQYILTNPNLPVLPSASACNVKAPATAPLNCAYLSAGYAPGSKLRDADLFHQGFAVSGNLNPGWRHQFMVDLQLWRNQNQIAMAASQAGYAAVLNPVLGLTLAGPITGTGTATTTPNGMIFTAAHFQIAHINYHLGMDGLKVRDREMPLNFDLHASRNLGAGFLRDAIMGIASFGETRKAGDLRLLYAYAIKDGNSMISEVTDDYVGTLSGVNIRTHEIRVDLGLTRFLAWQNYLYIVNPRRGNIPSLHFYVPYPTGANTTYRVQSQLQFKF